MDLSLRDGEQLRLSLKLQPAGERGQSDHARHPPLCDSTELAEVRSQPKRQTPKPASREATSELSENLINDSRPPLGVPS